MHTQKSLHIHVLQGRLQFCAREMRARASSRRSAAHTPIAQMLDFFRDKRQTKQEGNRKTISCNREGGDRLDQQ